MKCAGVWVGVVASLGVLSTDGSTLRAQAPSAGAPLIFEVASIKANKSGAPQVMINMQPGGRFTATNVPLRLLIRNAYRLQTSRSSTRRAGSRRNATTSSRRRPSPTIRSRRTRCSR